TVCLAPWPLPRLRASPISWLQPYFPTRYSRRGDEEARVSYPIFRRCEHRYANHQKPLRDQYVSKYTPFPDTLSTGGWFGRVISRRIRYDGGASHAVRQNYPTQSPARYRRIRGRQAADLLARRRAHPL